MAAAELTDIEFLQRAIQNGPHLMWFLGSGASRSSGMPTAADITWELKCKLYCLRENQDVRAHDTSNKAVQARIQNYMDSQGFPQLGDTREYSFYFQQIFADDYSAQRKYLQEALSTEKISSTVGHRALAALLAMERARVVFTTNFDEVVETTYASTTGRALAAFHLEGSYAALDALNAEQFPLYAKVHGDFRYQSIKNLSADLRHNDAQIQKCFLAAATRYGIIVTGYSGRDENVMSMFREAIDQNNAFPHGLFWTAPTTASASENVRGLLEYAHAKGIDSGIVAAGTFDEMLSKLWRNTPKKPAHLDVKVRSATAKPVSITLPAPGRQYPMLRTNALLIAQLPRACGALDYEGDVDMREVRSKAFETKPDCTMAYTERLLFWGARAELEKVLDPKRIRATQSFEFDDLATAVDESGFMKAFFEETIARGLLQGKPINLRKSGRSWYAVVQHDAATHELYRPLRLALGERGSLASVHGSVPGQHEVYWSEAASIHVEERNGLLWLLLRPEVWVSPLKQREDATDFLRARTLKRYNTQSFEVLSAWIRILVGDVGQGQAAKVVAFPEADFSAHFEISTRTAYSRRSTAHG